MSKDYFKKHINLLRGQDLYPEIYRIDGPSSQPEIFINAEKYTTFSSNNYLGLAGNEDVKKATIEGINKYGIGSGSTRILSGTLDVQVDFENALAKYFSFEDSVSFSSGYMANIGVIRMLVDQFPYYQFFKPEEGVIISDELNHASIIDGVRLAKAERVIYKNNDMSSLAETLEKYKKRRKLIITDGVFSMDGVLANLPEITKLAGEYDAVLMVDDSHAVGVLGPNGEGTAHHFGVANNVDVIMGSFTKAFGSIGGFITADKNISDYLRVTARSYIFSDPIIPAVVTGLIKTLELIANGDELRKRLKANASHLRNGLKRAGFEVIGDETAIVPLMIKNEKTAISFYKELFQRKFLAPCIRQPAVPIGRERIRFSVMASHSTEQIDSLLNACVDIGKKTKLI